MKRTRGTDGIEARRILGLRPQQQSFNRKYSSQPIKHFLQDGGRLLVAIKTIRAWRRLLGTTRYTKAASLTIDRDQIALCRC